MFTDTFDATNIQPQQGFSVHPAGMFDAQISNTYIKPTKDNTGGMFVVEYTTPAGRIENRYNLWNNSPQAVEIAQKELSALCHAVNIYRISFPKDQGGNPIMDRAGFELRGGRCKIEVAPQINKDGTPNGYMEVKKVYDSQGNEPGKAGAASQPQPAQQPSQQQPQSGGWGNQQAQQPQNNTGWSQGPSNSTAGGNTPPWGAPR
jgi:hypothetical protein